MALDDYRDKDGELSRKHGNTLIGTLRSHYGSDFAAGCSESDRLTDVLDQLDEGSLNKLARDYEAGKLAQILPIEWYETAVTELHTTRSARNLLLEDRSALSNQMSFVLTFSRRAFVFAMRDRDGANDN